MPVALIRKGVLHVVVKVVLFGPWVPKTPGLSKTANPYQYSSSTEDQHRVLWIGPGEGMEHMIRAMP